MENRDNNENYIYDMILLKEKIKQLEDQIDNCKRADKENLAVYEEKFRGYKEYINNTMEKIKSDMQGLFTDLYKVRETIVEIKAVVERASDKTAIQIAQISDKLNEWNNNKKDSKMGLLYPMIVSVIIGVLAFVAGKLVK